MSDKLLQEKIDETQVEFDRIQKEIEQIQGKVNEGNRLIGLRKEELIRLQGKFSALKELSADCKTDGSCEKPEKKKK